MKLLIRLIQLYVVLAIVMLLYLVLVEDLPFSDAIKPSLIWPKTLYIMIQAAGAT